MGICVLASSPALKNSQSEADVMKKQMEGLAREYDRLLKEHQELQVTLTLAHSEIDTFWGHLPPRFQTVSLSDVRQLRCGSFVFS